MIPKIIHYCWFGRGEKPRLAKKCIKTWEKYCKDYKFIEWNEDNFSIEDAPLYVRQAYESKKWAFVTDYVRLYAMVNFGGIYMDTDVEVVKPLDPFLKHRAFSGFESEELIPTGIMACEEGFELFKEFLSYYDTAKFILEDGSFNAIPNTDIMTEICKKKGLVLNNELQTIEGFTLYPQEVFCPGNPGDVKIKKDDQTVTIHWFAGSWLSDEHRIEIKEYQDLKKKHEKRDRKRNRQRLIRGRIKRFFIKIFGEKFYNKIRGNK